MPPRFARIIAAVAAHHDLSTEALVGPRRQRPIAWARQEVMWLARAFTGLSVTQIGAALGGRDHGTVLHGVRAVDGRRARDTVLAGRLDRMRERLEAEPVRGAPA